MKVSLFKNDKTTYKDEVIISIIVALSVLAGLALVLIKPSIGFLTERYTVVFGALLLLFAVMLVPCIFYRLSTNDKKDTK